MIGYMDVLCMEKSPRLQLIVLAEQNKNTTIHMTPFKVEFSNGWGEFRIFLATVMYNWWKNFRAILQIQLSASIEDLILTMMQESTVNITGTV